MTGSSATFVLAPLVLLGTAFVVVASRTVSCSNGTSIFGVGG